MRSQTRGFAAKVDRLISAHSAANLRWSSVQVRPDAATLAGMTGAMSEQLAIVYNPTKFDDIDEMQAVVNQLVAAAGWDTPRWYETTKDDPGTGQARQAVDDGATVVASFGGDGTVRSVAAALIDTDTPLGLLPGGTGNLLARNLEVPVDQIEEAVAAVVNGTNRRIDTGLARFLDDDGELTEEVFLVMVGMGLDADTMRGADEKIKAVLGWPAYVLSGAKSLVMRGFGVMLDADDKKLPIIQHARSVLIGNCGTLTAGIKLMPDALVDDGTLDAVVISPKGVMGWGPLVGDIVTGSRRGHKRLGRREGKRMQVYVDELVAAEVDGDVIGSFTRLEATIKPASLTVRVLSA